MMQKWILIALLSAMPLFAQTEKLNQFWNEYAFSKNLSEKWVLELDIGLSTSSVPQNSNIFYGMTQVYFRGWGHYYLSERWKLSAFYAFYINRNVPELEHDKTNEFRSAFQATYNLVRSRSTINLRMRLEDRHLEREDAYFEAVQRLRLQIKSTFPINGPEIQKDILYAFASEELFFKTKSEISGPDFFDRNRLTLGLGYALHDNLQVELSYANEYLPRDGGNELYNAIQLNVVVTDFLPTVTRTFKPKRRALDEGGGGM